MTDGNKRAGKNLLIVLAMMTVLIIGSIGAYFTATDEATNSFTVGSIDVEITEPKWDALANENENDIPDIAECVLPNMQIDKDPTVTNLSETNDAFIFVRVTVPKADILTANAASGVKAKDSEVTQLFQLNDSSNTKSGNGLAWDGNDSYNADSWYLLKTDTSDDTKNVYVFVYGNVNGCTALPAGETIEEPVFNSVTFCNAVGGQAIEGTSKDLKVEAFAIQTTDLTAGDKTEPNAVWAILSAQESATE